MPRRNGHLRMGGSARGEIQQALHNLETPATLPESPPIKTLEVVSARGLWFWVAAAMFGVAVGLFIARQPTRRR